MSRKLVAIQALQKKGWNFSVGMAQVNRYNLGKYSVDYATAFDPCANVRAGASILKTCFDRARLRTASNEVAWKMAYSCYYSGNFKTGFKADFKGQPSYVSKVVTNLDRALSIPLRGSKPAARSVLATRAPPTALTTLLSPAPVPRRRKLSHRQPRRRRCMDWPYSYMR